jgi:hypothetical protein
MAEQPSQTPLPSPGWTFLARGEKGSGMISRCPGGLIHVNYGNLTLRFQREEFLTLARMVQEAATRLQNVSPHLADHRIVARPSVTFSLN